jgi:LPS export ABC transporter protein LptC/lipopolysaccharide transport protein LptA
MMDRSLRRLRIGLLAGVAALLLAVGWTLRHPTASPNPSPSPSAADLPPGQSRLGGFIYRKLDKDGKQVLEIQAQSMVGQEQQEVRLRIVHAKFPYLSQGETGDAVITSDEAIFWPQEQKAIFQGHVHLVGKDDDELTTDSLTYRGDRGIAHTDYPVQFRRKTFSGSGTGMHYDSGEGKIKLLADAVVRVEGDPEKNEPPFEIHGGRAVLDRTEGLIRFSEGVEAHRGNQDLTAEQLQIYFDTATNAVLGAMATGDAVMRMSGSDPIPGAPGASRGTGTRILKGQRLDVVFRPNKTVQQVTAGPEADLTVLPGPKPGPKEEPEKREVQAKFLTFFFDEAGRMKEAEGQRDGRLTTEPIPPAKGLPRTVTCRHMIARLDPESGDLTGAEFSGDVEMTRGTTIARGQSGTYDAARKNFVLETNPEVLDTEDGGRLTADIMQVATDSGDLTAEGDVAHFVGRGTLKRRQGGLLQRDEPTVVRCRQFLREGRSHTVYYRQGALLRSGNDEIRAPILRVDEMKDGSRKMTAEDGVVSLFHPKENKEEAGRDDGGAAKKQPPAPVETRSQQMVYEEAKGQIVYSGDVTIKQGDIVSVSPEATVLLTPDGSTVQTMIVGSPVTITQGTREATGQRGTYTPATETMVLVGDRVTLKDPTQQVLGRSLTFHVADDRILVDGREEVRTETVIRKEPAKP